MLNQALSHPLRSLAVLTACSVAAVVASPTLVAQSVSAPLTVTTLAGLAGATGTTNGTGSAARFFSPAGIAFDRSGNLVVADTSNNIFRQVTPAGVVTTFSGTPVNPDDRPINVGSADGSAAAASFYIGEWTTTPGSNTIGRDGTGFYIADTLNNTVRKIAFDGSVTTLAGSAGGMGSDDGAAGTARFLAPAGVAADAAGNVFIADSGNNTIRRLSSGQVTTFAGIARTFGTTDGIGAAARFTNPSGIAIDSAGNLYVSDTGNHTIRKITPGGVVTTLAGSPGRSGTADGSGSQARFNGPTGIAVDSSGNVYVADTGNNAIRKVSPSGTVSTVAGTVGTSGSTDGIGTAALFNQPYGIAVDAAGTTIYIADTGNHTVRRAVVAASSDSLRVTDIPASRIQVNVGATVTLKIVASGSPAPTYQWSKDGAAISGATSSTLTLSSVTSADSGDYAVAVSSGVLTYSSALTQVQVFAPGTPVPSVTIITQPADRSINVGQSTTFNVEATSAQPLTYQWTRNGNVISGATSASYTVANATVDDGGAYAVTVSDGSSTASTNGASLTVTGTTSAVAPAITASPSSQTVAPGGSATFTVAASGTPAPTFQWQKNGATLSNTATISGATTSTLTISGVTAADAGSYTAIASNSAGSAVSGAATLTVSSTPPPPSGPTSWLSNLSVRTNMVAGQTLIVGLTVSGGAKDILVRGAGPALGTYGLSGLPDPRLDLYAAGETSVKYSNDNWDAALATKFTSVGAFPFTTGSKDAAFVQSLANGYTVQAPATASGTILVEAYDLDPGTGSTRLTNISARNQVGTGDNILIEGFVIRGTGTKKLLIRAIGPKLVDFGVSGVLADPQLEVYDSNNVKIATNNDWDSTLTTTFDQVGAFHLTNGSKDAAAIVTLNATPGGSNYTVQVKGADGGTGQAIVEIYEIP